jgi:head-tail adaptor
MKAGKLRHRLRLDAVTNTTDSFGAPVKTWTKVAEVPASIESASGREYLASGRDLEEEAFKIYIREVPGVRVDPNMRGTDVDTGRTFDITAVLPSHYRNMVTLIARSGGHHP